MSRAAATDAYRAILAQELHQDAWRYWLGVTATVSYDGEHLGEASLWGIDHTLHPNHQLNDMAWLIEVATDLIDEALQEAHDTASAVAVRLRERAENLTRLMNFTHAGPAN